jgi:CubicO group peptidase (beta-lactamase class C family)
LRIGRGAAGTWFWVDPTNDVIFVGMIQRLGGTAGDDLATQARTLTYQALLHPEK